MHSELRKCYLVLVALLETIVDLIANLVVGELPVDPGKQLGARLLKAHQMTLLEGGEVKPVPTSGRSEAVRSSC
jgi:hypothetical protein